jgi:putative SOS response-associated peptidase YedK
MCGRYGFIPGKGFYGRFSVAADPDFNLEACYNVYPGAMMPVIISQSPKQAVMMKWGLIPFWAKDFRIAYSTINARAEEIELKPAFRKPFKTQRCLVPASGFYEWKQVGPKEKIPYYVHLRSSQLFAFAGLYDVWKDAEGYPIKTYTIITVNPNKIVGDIHNRMPALLSAEDEDKWIDSSLTDSKILHSLLRTFPDNDMEAYQVSREVNNPKNDSPNLILPL